MSYYHDIILYWYQKAYFSIKFSLISHPILPHSFCILCFTDSYRHVERSWEYQMGCFFNGQLKDGITLHPLGFEHAAALGSPHSDSVGNERPSSKLLIKCKSYTWQDGTKNACWAIGVAVRKQRCWKPESSTLHCSNLYCCLQKESARVSPLLL